MMTPDEMIAVIQASKVGAQIERKLTPAGLTFLEAISELSESTQAKMEQAKRIQRSPLAVDWATHDNNRFDFISYDYRIKPEPKKPREWWVNNWALDQYAGKATDYDTIHVREVLP